MMINISNYKYCPWHHIKSIDQSFNWDEYFNGRIIILYKLKKSIEFDPYSNFYKQQLRTYEKEIMEENARWDSILSFVCEFFNTDINDVRKFISARSSIFSFSIEEVKMKLNMLMNWIKQPKIGRAHV